jgi:hypothetical protein
MGNHPDLHVEGLFEDAILPVCAPRLVEQGCARRSTSRAFRWIHHDIPMSMRAPPKWGQWLALAGVDLDRCVARLAGERRRPCA